MACVDLNWWRRMPPLRDSKPGRYRAACPPVSNGRLAGCDSKKMSRCSLRLRNDESPKSKAQSPKSKVQGRASVLDCASLLALFIRPLVCGTPGSNRVKSKAPEDWRSPRRWRNLRHWTLKFELWTFSAAIWIAANPAFACGPEFPNWMLDRGEEALLAAPIADFDQEMERLKLPPAKFTALITTNDHLTQSTEADLADLRAALRKTEISKPNQAALL